MQFVLLKDKNPNGPLPAVDAHAAGYTPLMWAANRKFVPIARTLLDAGTDVNAVAAGGSTAIKFIRKAEPVDLEILELLCRYRAAVTIKDGRGRNIVRDARGRATFSGKPEMRQILERYYPNIDVD